jgi:hypothetical protein
MTRNNRKSDRRRGRRENPEPDLETDDEPRQLTQDEFIYSIFEEAVPEGINAIIKKHPRFDSLRGYIANYIDPAEALKILTAEYNNIRQNYLNNPKGLEQALRKSAAEAMENGDFFNEKGKEIILRKSLEERVGGKGPIRWIKRKMGLGRDVEIKKGEDYLDATISAFNKLYELMKSGGYEKGMPEVERAITYVRNAGFADAALNVLRDYKVMGDDDYRNYKSILFTNVREGVEKTKKSLADYVTRSAAVVFALAGLTMLLINVSVTGNVIGASLKANVYNLIGILLLVIAAFFGFRKKKAEHGKRNAKIKKKSKKNKKTKAKNKRKSRTSRKRK